MGEPLKKLTLRGFKSIDSLVDFELHPLNILIGANGAGKSNLVDFFRLLRAMADERLQQFVTERGGADGFFYLGPQHTRMISAHLEFGQNVYEFDLSATTLGQLMINEERDQWLGGGSMRTVSRGVLESVLSDRKDSLSTWGPYPGVEHYVYEAVSSWVVYHFHDTSMYAPMRREQVARDRNLLRHDASNIAAFLLYLKETRPDHYGQILDAVRRVAPFFDDFAMKPEEKGGEEKVRLEWHQKGSDFPFQPSQLSDGSIRFICLATALLQPNPPATIVIDEPELGLHPYAIALLADLMHAASKRNQVLIATQSPILLDYFDPDSVIVASREDGKSLFRRPDAASLEAWLAQYSLGELWQKNVVDGGPVHE